MKRTSILCSLLLLSACKPPAADEYVERIAVDELRQAPSVPIDSPDIEGAGWADTGQANRMLYGKTGEPAILALECTVSGGSGEIHLTRYAVADPEATALMALIGNGHIARLPVDAEWNGKVWLWQGHYPAANPDLDSLTGPRKIELTIPGAGSIILNPSQRPAKLIDRCREF